MEENNNKFETNPNVTQENETTKNKSKRTAVVTLVIVILILLVTLYVANIYALSKEYENIFEMITSKILGTKDIEVQGDVGENIEKDNTENLENETTEVYAIENNTAITLGHFWTFEYDNSNKNYAEIYYLLTNYSTEPGIYYTLKITDEQYNSLIIDEEEKIIGGELSSVKIKKVSLDSKINISVLENDEEKIKLQIDLKEDLEKKVKIDGNPFWENSQLGDLKFSNVVSDDVYFTTKSHAYSEKLVGEYCYFSIGIQYGHSIPEAENVELTYYKNVNNLNLEEAFKSLSLINECFGAYGLSDVYGMDKAENITDVVIVAYEEMINLCNGLTIEKDGKEYTKESFAKTYNGSIIKDENVEIGYGIKTIKYHYEYDNEIEPVYHYMFIHNNNIYDIKVPANERINEEVQQFLDSLQLVEN